MNRAVLLAIDAGNTDTVVAAFEGARVVAHRRAATAGALEAQVLLDELRSAAGSDPAATVVATTGPRMDALYRELVPDTFGHAPLVIEGGPAGPDRLANCAAAHALAGGSCIVCDLGTATTVDAVGAGGEFLGGAIAPGAALAMHALAAAAERLADVELRAPDTAIGRDTDAAMRSGAVLGHAGLVDGLVERFREELGADLPALATGGLAAAVIPHCRRVQRIEPLLTLDGLRLLWEAAVTP